jgi:hypothetical protein
MVCEPKTKESRSTPQDLSSNPPSPALRPVRPGLPRVSVETVIPAHDADRFFSLYLEAFGPLRTQAAARQVLHESEFLEQMTDPRVSKFVAWDQHERPAGLTTLTRDLDTVPWVSPEYFAHRYPEHTARHAVYYWGFALTRPQHRRSKYFLAMLTAVADVVAADHGVCGYDICSYNNVALHLAPRVERLGHQLADVTFEAIDTQTYYCATLT